MGSPSSSAVLERARIDEEVRALERHGLARGRQMHSSRAQRLPQLGERDPQAGPRRLIEYVGPEPRGKPAPRMRAGVKREVGQHRAGPLRRRRSELGAIHAQLPAAGESDLEHRATLVDEIALTQAVPDD